MRPYVREEFTSPLQSSPQRRKLRQENSHSHQRNHRPETACLDDSLHGSRVERIFGAPCGCCAVRESAVENDGACAVDIGNVDQAQVQVRIGTIPNQGVEESCISVVVTATLGVHGAETCDVLRLSEARILTDLDIEMQITSWGCGICGVVCGAVVEGVWLGIVNEMLANSNL